MGSVITQEAATLDVFALILDDQDEIDLLSAFADLGAQVEFSLDSPTALDALTYQHQLIVLRSGVDTKTTVEQLKTIRNLPDHALTPIVVIANDHSQRARLSVLSAGADEVLAHPADQAELRIRLSKQREKQLAHQSLERSENILISMAYALEVRDIYTRGHSQRVGSYASALSRHMYKSDHEALDRLARGGLLHDIGKIGVPEAILNKTERLTSEEFEIMKSHTTRGAEICEPLPSIKELLPIIRSHHERWDGRGYPDGLKGEEITIDARLTAMADAFDAMTSTRSYRRELNVETALEIIAKEATQGQWEPAVARGFIDMMYTSHFKVLLVDSDEDVLIWMQHLIGNDFDVELATNAAASMKWLGNNHVDLVIVATELNDMSGLDLARKIRHRRATRFVPMLLLTNEINPLVRQVARQLWIQELIAKPIDMKLVANAMRTYLRSPGFTN